MQRRQLSACRASRRSPTAIRRGTTWGWDWPMSQAGKAKSTGRFLPLFCSFMASLALPLHRPCHPRTLLRFCNAIDSAMQVACRVGEGRHLPQSHAANCPDASRCRKCLSLSLSPNVQRTECDLQCMHRQQAELGPTGGEGQKRCMYRRRETGYLSQQLQCRHRPVFRGCHSRNVRLRSGLSPGRETKEPGWQYPYAA